MSSGKYDKRNTLNDLTGKEWLKLSSSFWFSEKCAADKDALRHPAPFLIKDIEKLISLFTKEKMVVLDIFCGSGTTLLSAYNLKRQGIGFDLNLEYLDLARERFVRNHCNLNALDYRVGDNTKLLQELEDESIDYIVTSPPYFNILKNKASGLRANKSEKGFRNGARQGIQSYGDDNFNLENSKNYEEFLEKIFSIFSECRRVLKTKKYLSIIISDFTIDKKEVCVTGDIVRIMQKANFEFVGNIALLQSNKPLYPFGYPYAYKINHHNQNILNFRKT
ncbi:site-specific DNA-methyltransferase, putative [Campylobacter upsaliensis RM3195]|uniref:Methyltransferase n=1 Tax=Campylobacter upsaliensis TaxID=28080 RepID=A0A381F3J0_CAMUP|nr:DNA methyltransferase [Campylobacter upsaliensis]EAL52527.1 site-specific DNA-methyltransferase, putative [Campylobacter upsaliensis RM3195]MCR2101396.1 site-specific DNA-methyltransferase [Campylobacter upsaliensis]MCR2102237.1 site-specific DNA-methyltransferase [Campylobacter upsaliensis]MCR2105177.1 site-specific DNA-methyltransferase [Campylobacter upsaliensis]SUX41067.1 site-specific DNA-methyltransferase [Campylobacter upsaliensis]